VTQLPNNSESDLLQAIAVFASRTVATAAADWSVGAAPDPALMVRAAELGLTALQVPTAHGGLGLDYAVKVRACEILAAADFGFAMSVVNTHNVAANLARLAPPDVAARFLPPLVDGRSTACTALTEPGAGSDVAAMTTTAVRDGDDWIITGEKTWIVNARHADLAIVYAQCGQRGDHAGIGAFLVDLTVPQCRRYPIDSPFSQTSIGTGGFVLDQCRVPATQLMLPPGTALKSILKEINGARIYVAAMCCGMVAEALAIVQDYGQARMTFGRPLVQHQAWRHTIADVTADLAAARTLVAEAVRAFAADTDAELSAAAAKLHAVTMSQRHLPALLHAMGAEGLKANYPFARHIAASHIAALTDGSSNMLRERLSRRVAASPLRDPQRNPNT
jgi:alkylation response protein AidB-like acyl-CoA dehydrogenase